MKCWNNVKSKENKQDIKTELSSFRVLAVLESTRFSMYHFVVVKTQSQKGAPFLARNSTDRWTIAVFCSWQKAFTGAKHAVGQVEW